MAGVEELDPLLERLGRQPFRSRFHLRGRERFTAEMRGMTTMRVHAADLIAARLAPASPHKDGKQTPYRGHPVFVAQHATATCCRGCLVKWHGIPAGRVPTADEQEHVVSAIERWLDMQVAGDRPGVQQSLPLL